MVSLMFCFHQNADIFSFILTKTCVCVRVRVCSRACMCAAFQTEGKLYLILDFLRGGDLFTRLSKEVSCFWPFVRRPVVPSRAPTWRSVRFHTKELADMPFVAWEWSHVKWNQGATQLVCVTLGCSNPDVPALFHVAGHVHRGRREVLPSRAGSGSGPSPQSGHHLQGPQTWEVLPTLEPLTQQKDSSSY